MRYKCIVTDLDGTLLDSKKRLSEYTIETMKQLMEKGIEIVPTTGRAFFAIPKEVMNLEGIRYAVSSNGVAVYDVITRQSIRKTCLSKPIVEKLFEILKGENVIYECFCDGKPYTSQSNYDNPNLANGNRIKADYIRATRTPVADIKEFILSNSTEIEGVNLILSTSERERVSSLIQTYCPNVYITSSAPDMLEISNVESGKHKGIRIVAELLNIDVSEMIAFGDNDNDVEMLSEAGLGIAVSNATEKCKSVADRITDSNDDDGVAKVLREIFELE